MSSNILPMPVAAAVLRGAPIKDHNPEDMRTVIDRVGLIRAAAREATLVHAQPAADMYWLTTDFYDKVSDFPPLRLPFPLMWFEWRMRIASSTKKAGMTLAPVRRGMSSLRRMRPSPIPRTLTPTRTGHTGSSASTADG